MARWLEKNMKFIEKGVTSYCQPGHFRPHFKVKQTTDPSTEYDHTGPLRIN